MFIKRKLTGNILNILSLLAEIIYIYTVNQVHYFFFLMSKYVINIVCISFACCNLALTRRVNLLTKGHLSPCDKYCLYFISYLIINEYIIFKFGLEHYKKYSNSIFN